MDWETMRMTQPEEGCVWELFHESSKINRAKPMPTVEWVIERMRGMWDSLPYSNYPRIDLPEGSSLLNTTLGDAIRRRETARELHPIRLMLPQLSAILYSAYGVTRDNAGTQWPRKFRTVPSGGALYPLEILVHATFVAGLTTGLYHYNPIHQDLACLREGDFTRDIADAMPYPHLAYGASAVLFITAIMGRSTFKYGDRGYRFLLIEAGHVAQNIDLSCAALGLGVVNIGGFYDSRTDAFLGLDGVQHSTMYLAAVGGTSPL